MILFYVAVIGACVITMAISSYLYGIAMSKCSIKSLFAINRHARSKPNDSEIIENIIEFVQFHSRANQLSMHYAVSLNVTNANLDFLFFWWFQSHIIRLVSHFSDIFQYFLMIGFMFCLITICGAMLMIQMQLVEYFNLFAKKF